MKFLNTICVRRSIRCILMAFETYFWEQPHNHLTAYYCLGDDAAVSEPTPNGSDTTEQIQNLKWLLFLFFSNLFWLI